jgi:hypothetical protein
MPYLAWTFHSRHLVDENRLFLFFIDLSLKILQEDKKCPGSLHIIKW